MRALQQKKIILYVYTSMCTCICFCLLHPVSPSEFIVAGTNLFADTRLILQAQLPNANPPGMYLEFVQG